MRAANQIGADGWRLLDALEERATPRWLRDLPAVQTLSRVWAQHYHPRQTRRPSGQQSETEDGDGSHEIPHEGSLGGHWRAKADVPPAAQMQNSPYDPDARYGKKREISWVGYKAHLTETCEAETPHLIVHVATTPACASDEASLTSIHQHLARRELLPSRQLVDAGYVDADVLATNHARFGVDVLKPSPAATIAGKPASRRASRVTASPSTGKGSAPSVRRGVRATRGHVPTTVATRSPAR